MKKISIKCEILKKVGIILLTAFGVFVVIPFIINCLFKFDWNNEFLRVEWGAGDALSFYGSIIASFSTIIGIFLTIRYSQENYKEDVRNRVLPFISFDELTVESKFYVFESFSKAQSRDDESRDESEHIKYREYISKSYYCIIKDKEITYQRNLNKEDKDLIQRLGLKMETTNNSSMLLQENYLYMPIQIMNVGNGIAVNFRYGLNRAETKIKDRLFVPPILFGKNDVCYVYFFAKNYTKEICGKYILSFVYEDIYKNKYIQDFKFNIVYDKSIKKERFGINMDNTQERLEEF